MFVNIAEKMIGHEGVAFFLAIRPSRPRMCRNRRRCQGQARSGRFACLDMRRLASDHRCLRAMDVNTSGRGSEHEQPMQGSNPKHLFSFSAVIPQSAFSLPLFLTPPFPGYSCPLSPSGPDAFPVGIMRFLSLRKMLSGSNACAFLPRVFFFPHACLFIQRYPGGPAYVTCTRTGARYSLRLAGGCAPLTPARPAKGSGQTKDQRQ